MLLPCLASLIALSPAVSSQPDPAADAKALVNKSGIRAGLVVHLDCGRETSAGLTAALAKQGNLLVHGLAFDAAAGARAQRAIEVQGVLGRAMVEYVDAPPLPYLNDLANLVVAEDLASLAQRGVTREEILRVIAPGGMLCTRTAGQWTVAKKPRPKSMDDWTHPQHGPDGNMVSDDKLIEFPLGFRWLAGLPLNVNRWASTRGWVVANGRVFELTSSVLENLGPSREKPHYLVARDAWNGLPLWKHKLGTTDDGAFLTHQNAGPLVADDTRVYAATPEAVLAFDAATGKLRATHDTKHAPARLLLLDGVLIAACWQAREPSKAVFDRTSLWATWTPTGTEGTVEAYDTTTDSRLWSLPLAAEAALAADGVVYLLRQVGNPPTAREIVAVDLRTGEERWRVPNTRFGNDADLHLSCAGPGYLVVARRVAGELLGLSPTDGSLLWKHENAKTAWTPVVDGLLWHGLKKYDPKTGEEKGNVGAWIGDQGCTPSAIVNNIVTRSRGCGYTLLPPPGADADAKAQSVAYRGARGGCMEGMVPANGMFYTAQNWCRCAPGQVYGFVALGPSGEWPSHDDFAKAAVVEKGPAFGSFRDSDPAEDDWPLFRHDTARTGSATVPVSATPEESWRAQLVPPRADDPLADAWRSRLRSPVTAPVVANGRAFVATVNEGQLIALDARTGRQQWRAPLGSRVDTPPTVYGGLCFLGCHDGRVYAFRAADGQLAWRTRLAPWERRMIAFGMVESVWPVVGTLALHEGVLFACAGRTTESDGGIVMAAFDPATGERLWTKAIGPGPLRQIDMPRYDTGAVLWHHLALDPNTGEGVVSTPAKKTDSQGGLWDGSWTQLGTRRSGNAFQYSKARGNLLVWNDELVVTPSYAVPRRAAIYAAALRPEDYVWQPKLLKTQQVEAMALASDEAVFAGRNLDNGAGPAKGFLTIRKLVDGRQTATFPLTSPPTYDGLAIAGGRVYVSQFDGALVCFGEAGQDR